jgi:F0F1-type ATP synthase assembly protein I
MDPSGLKSFGLSSSHPMQGTAPNAAIFDGRRQVLVQAGLVACCAAASLALGGPESALAALCGGLAALAGTLAFLGVARWRSRPAPTPWQALRALAMAEAAKWAVSLVGLVSLLSGRAGVDAAGAAPGAVVIGFCVAWAAPLLALVKRN